jgi:phage anti-repressor protein
MKELIKVTTNKQGLKVVSARELHEWLQTGDHFTQWAKRIFEYGFS